MKGENRHIVIILLVLLVFVVILNGVASARPAGIPRVRIDWGGSNSRDEVASSLQILILITILSLAPAILIMMTSFTRIIIVLSFLRHAIGTQQIPPNQVLVSFALFLTFLTMYPTFKLVNQSAIKPYMEGSISQKKAFVRAESYMRQFMFRQTREKDLELFLYASDTTRPNSKKDIPTMVLIPSFILSELRTSFTMGFTLFITFVIIDMVVASVLMSIGMFMLPPMMISLPIKIMIFIMVDGWYLVVKSIIFSFS